MVMKPLRARVLLVFAVAAFSAIAQSPKPPAAPVRPVADTYFGQRIVDPYRYMEDLNNSEVQAWFKAQNDFTRSVLARIPKRAELLKRIKELDESAVARVFDVHRLPGDRYFYQKRLATEDTAKLYTRAGLSGTETLLVDPDKLPSQKGAHNSINYYSPSFDGRYVAYGVSPGGSEEAVLHVMEVSSRHETGDVIDRAQFGPAAWGSDGKSFFYNRLQKLATDAAPTERYLKSRVYRHVLGSDPETDKAVFGWDLSLAVKLVETDIPFINTFPNSSYALAIVAHGVQNETTIYSAQEAGFDNNVPQLRKLCDIEDEITGFDVQGTNIFLLTHKGASRFRVTRTDLSNPDVARAQEIVPASEAVIRNIAAAQDALYVQSSDGGVGRLVRVPYTNDKPEKISLPFQGSVFIANSDPRLPGALIELTSWSKAGRIYSYDTHSREVVDTRLQPIGPFDNPEDVVTEEVKIPSYDGTQVPLSIIYKRGLKRDGSNPALLMAYGAYGISMDPFFDPKLLGWLELGGLYAVAHVRGGGEYGEDWHLAGKGLTKPNTWRDLIASAEHLINNKYTSSSRLAINGGSAGGITVGRAITSRPDLFAAALDQVPCSDMVRAELSPNGPPNIPEFGSVKTHAGFEDLMAMSAYHHVQDGTAYPAVLLTTGFNDPRVTPWEPGKLTARLQAASSSGKPVLLRVDYDAGHGLGSTKTQQQELMADNWSFLLWQMGVRGFQP
jgi:prolyl oligopeptidase